MLPCRRTPLCAAFVLPWLAATAGAQHASSPPSAITPLELRSPFHVVDAGAADSARALALVYDPFSTAAELQAHARDELLSLRDFALPGAGSVELLLRRVSVLAPGDAALVHRADGSVERLTPSVQLFSGSVPGRASRAFLAVSREQLNGYVELDDVTYVLSSGGDRGDGRAWISRADALDSAPFPLAPGRTSEWCGAERPRVQAEPDARELLAVPQLRHADVFIELDHRYRALFASNQAALDYAVTLVGATSEIYRRDLGILLEVPDGYMNLWNTTPPWGVLTTFGDISRFANWWSSGANPNRALRRAAVHVLTNPVFGGVASSISAVCSIGSGYEISSVFGHFPVPTQHTHGDNWDLLVVAHEFGHTFGAQHTHEVGVSCDDGTGPDRGTIMGYCHQIFGVGGVGMRFHRVSQNAIRLVSGGRPCVDYQILERGDYDGNGAHDALDLAELDAYLAQGFRSLGCEDSFDLDADTRVDAWDRAILAAHAGGASPAHAVERLGSGANEIGYGSLNAPVLGSEWMPYVSTKHDRRPVVLLGFDRPAAGSPTPYGELLVSPPTMGGAPLFRINGFVVNFAALWELALPRDASLAGLEIFSQAMVLTPHGPELLNALDLHVGFF